MPIIISQRFIPKVKCCICGKKIPINESNNPYPVRKYSQIGSMRNRCCHNCDKTIVIPMRLKMLYLSEEKQIELHKKLKRMSYEELKEFGEETMRIAKANMERIKKNKDNGMPSKES